MSFRPLHRGPARPRLTAATDARGSRASGPYPQRGGIDKREPTRSHACHRGSPDAYPTTRAGSSGAGPGGPATRGDPSRSNEVDGAEQLRSVKAPQGAQPVTPSAALSLYARLLVEVPSRRQFGLRVEQPSIQAGGNDLREWHPAQPCALFQRRAIGGRNLLRKAGDLHLGEEDLLGEDAGSDEEGRAEHSNGFGFHAEAALLPHLGYRAGAHALLAAI